MKTIFNPLVRRVLRPYRLRIFFLCLLTVLRSVLQVAMALLFRFVIDAALTPGGKTGFWGAVLIGDMLALVLVHTLHSWYSGSTADRLMAGMRQSILRTAMYSRDKELLENHSGQLLNRSMEDVATLCDGAVNVLPGFVGQISRLVAALSAIMMLSAPVATVLLLAAVVVGSATACIRPLLKKRHRMVRQSDEQLMAVMQENLQQQELVQSLGAQEQTLKRFAKRIRGNLKVRFRRRVWSVGSATVINVTSQLSAGVLLLWGASRIAAETLSYGSLTAMLQLLAQFRTPVLALSGLWSRLASLEVSIERLAVLLTPVQPIQPEKNVAPVRQIVFEDVTFSYPGDEMPVLQHFSFRFPLEGWSCLTGISGKGKSTMFKLILGLHTPQEGRIYLETEAGQLPCSEATRHLFAYVPQDYALFSGTVLENFQLIDPDITEQTLRRVLHIAQADFVWELTDREHTQLRENNTGLSKGQLQRLAIARAVLMDRPVFLLDECTSALDTQTEDAVLRQLRDLGKQAILVTHRPDAVRALQGVEFVSMEE